MYTSPTVSSAVRVHEDKGYRYGLPLIHCTQHTQLSVCQEAGHHFVQWATPSEHGIAVVDPSWTCHQVWEMYQAGTLHDLPGAVLNTSGGLHVLLERLGAPACPECGYRTTNSHACIPRLCSRDWCQPGVTEMVPVRDSERVPVQPYPYAQKAAA